MLAATYSDSTSAAIARGMLEANGIPSLIENDVMNTLFPIYSTALGYIRLMVRESDLEKARQLLAEHGDL